MNATHTDTTAKRKLGDAMPIDELQSLPNDKLIDRVLMFVRTDFGGKDKQRVALERGRSLLPELSSSEFDRALDAMTTQQQLAVADAIIAVAAHAAKGSRTRLASTTAEMRRRWGANKNPPPSPVKI